MIFNIENNMIANVGIQFFTDDQKAKNYGQTFINSLYSFKLFLTSSARQHDRHLEGYRRINYDH